MMPTYPNSDELTSIAQYFFSEAPQEIIFLQKSFNMETNERTIWACSPLREKPKKAAPPLLAASLAENLYGKKGWLVQKENYLELF